MHGYMCVISHTVILSSGRALSVCQHEEAARLAQRQRAETAAAAITASSDLGTTHCNTMQHTATQCNTLQHTATHCNTLQHTATYCTTL